MATYVLTEDASALTSGSYFDGTDAGTAQAPGMFAFAGGDADDTLVPAEEGAMGIVGPIRGASQGNNPAQPGSMAL